MSDIIQHLPAIALRGTTILPDMIVHFDVSREKSMKAIEKAMVQDQKVFLITQRDPETEEPAQEDLYKIGTIAEIKQLVKTKKNMVQVLVEGQERGELLRFEENPLYLEAEIALFEEEQEEPEGNVKEAMLRGIKELFVRYCNENPKLSKDLAGQILELEDVRRVIDQIAVNLPMKYEDKQKILEAVNLEERYEVLGGILCNEIDIMQIRTDLNSKVKERVDKNQRDYILREQLKVIREELGDQDTLSEADQFKEQVSKLKASKEVKEKINREIDRFKNAAGMQAEAGVIRSYIETLLSLPWDKVSRDNKNLAKAKKILEEDHYGLEKVKERIMEFLAVRTLTKKGESPILCLAGPPGTGKTSIARSVARALDKEYVRMSLGGVRDEAEIRGHRRTYIGAMPGRIANGLIQAGVKNPLMLLDEIDKVSSDYKGDTSSALLEVLDSEQNRKFRDHYVEIPLDLSEVLFIATANDLQTIPRPLLDRMEVIEISSYTQNEKEHIAREHLIPKQIKAHGLKENQLLISDEALREVIAGYTKEAGVRSLERKLGEICRKTARKILEDKEETISVNVDNLESFLGRARYTYQRKNKTDEVGIVRGLAWTSVGGDTLQIEVNLMPGKGEFLLTGQLGDVMKESAQAGISYIRSVAEEYGIKPEFFQKHDLHIHIPEGAVPKDGPSAGITMATAMLSAMTNTPVKANVAMTGEITLRGRVLPIGGLKEKLLAAKSAGMKKVLIPFENQADVEELDEEITGGMKIVPVKTMKEVLKHALV
ncbi:endopeptidase La [Blautia hansenii]|uniref:Lon protease n=1 Tax=Blautia hansenii TaxID=1322 RepID=A0ABX2I3L1_BLAHA|nr:endopeptidase La [Blautia hansenii]MCB5599574.1 endopeptidase La [Blautia hansenii]NSJ85022.1 endopeptidase La [Blautia hansenii]